MDYLGLLRKVNQEIRAERPLCRAVIVEAHGSAPRGKGAQMLLLADHSLWGTIGGGALEAEVVKLAGEALRSLRPQAVKYSVGGGETSPGGMICGGNVTVLIEPLAPNDAQTRNVYAAAETLARQGGRGMLITSLGLGPKSQDDGQRLLVVEGDEPVGSKRMLAALAGRLEEQFEELCTGGGKASTLIFEESSRQNHLLWEAIQAKPHAVLMGAGHVSQALATLLPALGFEVTVVDDRPEFANLERFPMAKPVVVEKFDSSLDGLELGPHVFMVIMTRGHGHDQQVLAQALQHRLAYIGMIGSTRKTTTIFTNLEKMGFSKQDLGRVYSPIGIGIGAQTPEEIAVSIAAELISVRAGQQKPKGQKAVSLKLTLG